MDTVVLSETVSTVSPARIEANRRNAQNSTGPRTEAGKAVSRGNSVKHGYTGAGVVLPEALQNAYEARRVRFHEEYQADTDEKRLVVDAIALATVRIDDCAVEQHHLRVELASRAQVCWDEDRRGEVEALASGLARHPERVQVKLRQSVHGVEWLLSQWHGLGRALAKKERWSDDQKRLALDLLGTPEAQRDGDPHDLESASAAGLKALVAEQVARLHALKDAGLEQLDAWKREEMQAGRGVAQHIEARRLRGYESANVRLLYWSVNQLQRLREGHATAPRPAVPPPPRLAPNPAPKPPPTPRLNPVLATQPAEPSPQPQREPDLLDSILTGPAPACGVAPAAEVAEPRPLTRAERKRLARQRQQPRRRR